MNESSILPPGRAPASSSGGADSRQRVTGLERAMGAVRLAIPLVQRLLPLLDGNYGSAVSNLLNPRPPAPPPPPPVNLTPIEDGLTGLQAEHRDLRGQVQEQSASLTRVEEQLEMVGEATGRNTLAQQELMEELKAVGKKVDELKAVSRKANVFASVALGLLAVSMALNTILLLHFLHIPR